MRYRNSILCVHIGWGVLVCIAVVWPCYWFSSGVEDNSQLALDMQYQNLTESAILSYNLLDWVFNWRLGIDSMSEQFWELEGIKWYTGTGGSGCTWSILHIYDFLGFRQEWVYSLWLRELPAQSDWEEESWPYLPSVQTCYQACWGVPHSNQWGDGGGHHSVV